MIGMVLSLINPIARVTEAIAKARAQYDAARNDRERIAAEERMHTLRMQRDILVKEKGSGTNALVRMLFAAPFIAYTWKLVLWDKVLGLGVTDKLSDDLTYIWLAIVGFYFAQWLVGRTARILRR